MTRTERVTVVLLGLLLLGLFQALAVTVTGHLLETIKDAAP